MAANPLTYTELEAFERKALVRFTAWEADLIMRLDDAVIGVWAEQVSKARPKAKADDAPAQIPVTNTKGIKALFAGIAAGRKPPPTT